METKDRKTHWENIYEVKNPTEVSWYQPTQKLSIDLISSTGLSKNAAIIDVGGGDSFLAEALLAEGYTNVTVVDISAKAIARARERMGSRAGLIKWIVADIAAFEPPEQYDLWHDRAAFHFLTKPDEIRNYISIAAGAVMSGGSLIVGTFSENGPQKCSGLEISQYSPEQLTATFEPTFKKKSCLYHDHPTPFGTVQNFTFCMFRRI